MGCGARQSGAVMGVMLGIMVVMLACIPDPVWAAASGMPWEAPLQAILNSISGPVAMTIGVIAIVIFGLALAMSDGGGLRTALGIVFGLAIAFSATSFGVSFFGFAGGVLRVLGV
jgi:type IV secretory pathway VirB2 component (pilin)